jgi:hypothetical protein
MSQVCSNASVKLSPSIANINPDIAVEVKIELQKKRKANKNAPFH